MYLDVTNFLATKLPEVKKDAEIEAITSVARAASAYVDQATQRPSGYFQPSPLDPTVRFFRGDGTRILRIPTHIIGTATVENVPLASYYENGISGWLYKIDRGTVSFSSDGFPVWTKGVLYNVAARWGYAGIPDDIKEAVSQIALRWWHTQKGTLSELTPSGFVVERDVPLAARSILENYAKGEFEL